MNILSLTLTQLRRAASIKAKIETLESRLERLLNNSDSSKDAKPARRKKRAMSAAGRKAIAAAQKARWAKIKAAAKK